MDSYRLIHRFYDLKALMSWMPWEPNTILTASTGESYMPIIKIKRVYYRPLKSDGCRILVDRFWPRGLKKENAFFEEWAKELAPSERLKNWFDKDPFYWQPFTKKYQIELSQNNCVPDFIEKYQDRKIITLLYATSYDRLTHAIILKDFLENRFRDL